MLINGVEIVNYKSDDSVYYGPIANIGIFTGGSNYDAANAPSVVVSDPEVSTGTTALVQSVVSGSFVDIEVDPVNFDIEEIVRKILILIWLLKTKFLKILILILNKNLILCHVCNRPGS